MKKKISTKKYKLALGVSLLIAGTASSIIGINYFHTNQFKVSDFGNFMWSDKTTAQDVLDAINSDEHLKGYKDESLSFLRAKVYTYDSKVLALSKEKAQTDANTQSEAYEKELNEAINKYYDKDYFETQRKGLASPCANIYVKMSDLNSKYSIDPIDYHEFKDILLPQAKEKILNSASVSQKPQLTRKFNFLESQMEDKILHKHTNSFYFNEFLASVLNDQGLSEKQKLENAGSYAAKMICEKLLILNKNPEVDFVSLLASYSADGKTGYEEKNILDSKIVNKLFLVKRDFLGNVDLENPNWGDNPENPGEIGDIVNQDYLPLDKYIPIMEELPSFEENEIIPGYTLHAKIVNIDGDTNSDVANVKFEIGISITEDLNSDIYWIHNDEEEKGYIGNEYKLRTFEQKLNFVNNKYGFNNLQLEYKNKEFNAVKIGKRTTISDLLQYAETDENDHYCFNEQNPYLVDAGSLKLEGIVSPHQLVNEHKNEKIMLAITKVNTNFIKTGTLEELLSNQDLVNDNSNPYRFKNLIPYVEAKWVIADTVPEHDSATNIQYKIVKEYEWINALTHTKIPTLSLYFPYSTEDLESLQEANTITKLIHDFYILGYDENGNGRNIAKDIRENMRTTAGLDGALVSLLVIFTAVSDLASCLSIIDIWSAGTAIAGSILDTFLSYNGCLTAAAKIDILPSLQETVDLIEKFKELVPKDIAKIYAEFYIKLNDELISVKAKIDIAAVAKNFIFVFDDSMFKFFDYVGELTKNEDFMKEEKKWANYFRKDTFLARDFLRGLVEKTGVGDKDTFTNGTKAFLDYHNPTTVSAYNTLEKENISNIASVEQGIIYEFRLHRIYFSYYTILNLTSWIFRRLLGMLGIYLFVRENVGQVEGEAESGSGSYSEGSNSGTSSPKAVEENIVPAELEGIETTTEKQVNVNVKLNITKVQGRITKVAVTEQHVNWVPEHPESSDSSPIDSENSNFRELDDLDKNPMGEQQGRLEEGRENITNHDEAREFAAREKSDIKKLALVAAIIVIVVAVVQILVDNLITNVPEDKAKIIQEMQNEI